MDLNNNIRMRKLLINLLKYSLGRRRLQWLYDFLFKLSIAGMNFGNGGDFKDSGESYVLAYLKKKYKNEKFLVLFDIGANVGEYSQMLSLTFGANANIHSFEPSKKTFEAFVETTKGIASITPNNLAIGEQDGELILFSNDERSGLSSVYQRRLDHIGISMEQSEKIMITTIDAYCQKQNINKIHFMKLDIEGHEFKALLGAKQMIENGHIQAIQFEFGGCNIDSRTYFQDFFYLLNDKYHLYRILKDGIYEIKNYSELFEIFTTVNYFAELRS